MWERRAASVLGLLIALCALARGAHDHWAASAAHLCVLGAAVVVLWRAARGPGLAGELLWPLGAWAAVLVLSFLGAVNPAESFLRLKDCLAAALLFAAALQVLRGAQAVESLCAPLVPLFWVQALVAARQHLAAADYYSASYCARWDWACLKVVAFQQSPGTLVNANAATAFHLLWLPALIGVARSKSGARAGPRLFWASGAAACAAALPLHGSAWGVLCLGAALPWLAGPEALAAWLRRHRRAAAGLAVAAVAAAAALLVWKFGQSVDATNNPLPAGANSWRLHWWKSGFRMLIDAPWLGVGPGNFASAYLAYASGAARHTLFAHSVPVALAAETGLLGLGAALAFLGAWILRLRRSWPELRSRWPFALGVGLFLLFGTISVGLEYLANLLGLALAMAAAVAPAARPGWRPRGPVLALGAALAVAAVPDLLAPWQAERFCVAAARSLEGGDPETALRGFRTAAALDPRSWEARRGEAHALASRTRPWGAAEDLEAALASQRKAAELNRLNGALRWELALMLESAGRRDEALRELREAVRLGSARARADFERLSGLKGP